MISQYENKSGLYLDSAEFMHGKNRYVAVPHCAYYSCVLMMRDIWFNIMGKTEEDISIACRDKKTGSHNILINGIVKYIRDKSPNTDWTKFNNMILELKTIRVKADYSGDVTGMTESENSIDLSANILPILKKARR